MRKNYNWKRFKDPVTGKWVWPTEPHRVRNLPLYKYIETRTVVLKETGCWDWITKNGKHASNATHTELEEGYQTVGRASWFCFFGLIPKNIDVCHTCDNGHCANPMHLFLGTRKDNMQDCVAKGRHIHGERHPLSKLNDDLIKEIKRLRAEGLTYERLAKDFEVSVSQIWNAVNGKSWRHVK